MNQNLFIFSHVTTSSVQKLFSSLDNNKATGLNGISVDTLGAGSPILMYLSFKFLFIYRLCSCLLEEKKLFCYGFRDTWFQSYLSNCVRCTIFDDTLSTNINEEPVGVPNFFSIFHFQKWS